LTLLLILIIIYFLLGLLVDVVATLLPESIESNLARLYEPLWAGKSIETPQLGSIHTLLNELNAQCCPKQSYQLHIVQSNQFNALALPGNHIVIFSSLLNELDSENELAFVLAHELGHFQAKDHLRIFGRGLVLFVISNIFLGQDNAIYTIISKSLSSTEMRFSQGQETAADLFALELLVAHYGHATGAVSFLEKTLKKHSSSEFFDFFRSHPHPASRIKAIKKKIQKEGYREQTPRALDSRLKAVTAAAAQR